MGVEDLLLETVKLRGPISKSQMSLRHFANGLARTIIFVTTVGAIAASDGEESAPRTGSTEETSYSLHGQATLLPQGHPSFFAKYSGTNSLSSDSDLRVSFTATVFAGIRVWNGGEIFFNPESTAGSGISDTHGIAGYTNGEIYRVDSSSPKFYPSRFFIKQTFGLGGVKESVPDGPNSIAGNRDVSRITVTFGKFSLNDVFDFNTYSHDPRAQFLNWVLMDNGAWDYAADTRGYTYALVVEWNAPKWAVRLGSGLVATDANALTLETDFLNARGDNLEVDYRYSILGHAGTARFLAYLNRANMGNYQAAIQSGPNPDITKFRSHSYKYGFGINVEQELTSSLGLFLRVGWNDGKTETWMFTEVDSTFSVGTSLKGSLWGCRNDAGGLALILNGLSDDHRQYLAAGGYGFIIGDGGLNYGWEGILETYYSYRPLGGVFLTGDYQFVLNPAYNQDRGPVHVLSLRMHAEI